VPSVSQMQSWGSPARRISNADEEMSLLPREEQPRGGNRRLARYRAMQTAVPCALVAGMLMAIIFTVGHTGTIARRAVSQHSMFSDTALFLSDSAFASEHPLMAPAAFSTINLVQLKTPSHARGPHRLKSQQQQEVSALSPDSAVYRHDGIHERREAQRARVVDT